jgi:DNA-binding NarL/FixJ family response regulator
MNDRDQVIVDMTRAGYPAHLIAERLGICRAVVHRVRRRLGIASPYHPPLTEEEIAMADQLLSDGCSYTEVAATLGRSRHAIAKRFPNRGWEPGAGVEIRRMKETFDYISQLYGAVK